MAKTSKRAKPAADRAKPAKPKEPAKGEKTAEPGKPAKNGTPVGREKSAEPAVSRPELPPSTLVWVLLAGAALWFAALLLALRFALTEVAKDIGVGLNTLAATVTWLPSVIAAAVVVGAAAGLAVRLLLLSVRWPAALAGGALAAGVTGGALFAGGHHTIAAVGVAVAALIGGLISAAPPRVLAAALASTLVVAVIQVITALPFVISPVRNLLDGSGTGPEVASAHEWITMTAGVLSGIAAGLVAYALLRRMRPTGLGGHIAAGGAAGGFALTGELVSRITLPYLISSSGGLDRGNLLVLQLVSDARLNGALLLFFVGAVTALIALGRSKPKKQLKARPASTAAPKPAKKRDSAQASD